MKKNQKRLPRFIITGVFLLAAGGGFFGYIRTDRKPEVTDKAESPNMGSITVTVTATGTLHPVVTVQVGSQVSGRILELFADFNSPVTKGQVIAKIESNLFQTEVTRARANLLAANASVARAEAELADSKRRHERAAALAEKRLLPQAEADSALAGLQGPEAQIASARASTVQAKAMLEQAKTNLAYTTIKSPINGVVISTPQPCCPSEFRTVRISDDTFG